MPTRTTASDSPPSRDHITVKQDGAIVFDYPAKGGIRRVHTITDPLAGEVVRALRRRRGGPPQLLSFRERRWWMPMRSDDINDYLKEHLGSEFSAKDFRIWNATVLAAVSLGADGEIAASKAGRKRAMDRAVAGVSELLGNTKAVARRA